MDNVIEDYATHLVVFADDASRTAFNDVREELQRAMVWPAMNSAHEGYAVLLEEVDELWEHVKVKQGKRDIAAMRKEAVQVAAMAIRFMLDVCDDKAGNR